MADKYIYNNSGVLTEKEAKVTSAGAGDAGKIPALDAAGKLDSTLMPVGIGSETDSIVAYENLTAGDYVNVFTDSTVAKVRKADATTAGKEAHGFVLSAVTTGNNATVYRISQTNTQHSSLTKGAKYYLATTAGTVSATPPSSSGNVIQFIGIAKSDTEIIFMPRDPIVLA